MKLLKRGTALLLLLPMMAAAQKGATVDVNNKTGLVSVNGKEAFFLKSESSVPWQTDYGVENLSHKQIAYLALKTGYHYKSNTGSHDKVEYYKLTFTHSGAHCNVWHYQNSNTIIKGLATVLVEGELVKNGEIDTANERKFVMAHEGFMTPEKKDTTIAIAGLPPGIAGNDTAVNGAIVLRDNFIYYKEEIAGTYKTVAIDTDMQLVIVHSVSRNKVAEITHVKNEPTWTIITLVDQKKMYLPYDKATPLEELFRFLIKKRYL